MSRIGFGAFLAPHHLPGESLALQIQRDLDLVEQMDRLGYDEFWCGEHHSTGWETIASPEMFLAGAAMRTRRIKLGTGVVSLPYHHPFNVAQRVVQLDHMSQGRALLGTGPGRCHPMPTPSVSIRWCCVIARTRRSACCNASFAGNPGSATSRSGSP